MNRLLLTCSIALLAATPVLARGYSRPERTIVREAVMEKVSVGELPVARVRVSLGARAGRCWIRRAMVEQSVMTSGEVPVRVQGVRRDGVTCSGWVFAKVKIYTFANVATRDLPKGALASSGIVQKQVLLTAGAHPIAALPPGSTMRRFVKKGTVIEARHLRLPGPDLGASVVVELRKGALTVSQRGVAIACSGARTCARLPSGRQVSGAWRDGALRVELP